MNLIRTKTARDHLLQMKAHHTEHRFKMDDFITDPNDEVILRGFYNTDPGKECGTAFCLGGLGALLFARENGQDDYTGSDVYNHGTWYFDLTRDQAEHWFYGMWSPKVKHGIRWGYEGLEEITIDEAITFLAGVLDTGNPYFRLE